MVDAADVPARQQRAGHRRGRRVRCWPSAPRSRAARIGLFNTPAFLTDRRVAGPPVGRGALDRADALRPAAVLQRLPASAFGLEPLNELRRAAPATRTSSSGSRRCTATSTTSSGTSGSSRRTTPTDQMMGELLTTMVAYDAFTQALTNPLLAPQVFNEDTFTPGRACGSSGRRTRCSRSWRGTHSPVTTSSPASSAEALSVRSARRCQRLTCWRARSSPTQDPDAVADALARGELTGADLKLLTKHFLALLSGRTPGRSVEVRVPPYAAAQVVPGVRHTRGTPPAVVELDGATWVALAPPARRTWGGRLRRWPHPGLR